MTPRVKARLSFCHKFGSIPFVGAPTCEAYKCLSPAKYRYTLSIRFGDWYRAYHYVCGACWGTRHLLLK